MNHHAEQLRLVLDEATLRDFFARVWDEVLVPIAGAYDGPNDRDGFVSDHLNTEYPCTEFRFQGSLGFGGKFRMQSDLSCAVECYPEDETPNRQKVIDEANQVLAQLTAKAREIKTDSPSQQHLNTDQHCEVSIDGQRFRSGTSSL